MLKQTQQLPYIGIFKLSSGEEFIGKVTDETAVSYTISNPRCLVQTERGLQFAPLMMLGELEGDVTVPKPLISSKPNNSLLGQYESSISGIALPKKTSIIT